MSCRLPPATPRKARSHKLFKPVPALQSIERAVEGLHKLIEVLPQTATLREIQSAIMALNKIRTGLVIKAMRAEQKAETAPQKPARSALSVSVFKAEALTGRRQRRRGAPLNLFNCVNISLNRLIFFEGYIIKDKI